jgi:hypothetical protein
MGVIEFVVEIKRGREAGVSVPQAALHFALRGKGDERPDGENLLNESLLFIFRFQPPIFRWVFLG